MSLAAERLSNLALSPTGFLFDPRTGTTFTVNPTGAAILEVLRDGGGLQDVVDRLADRFATTRADLRRDAMEYVRVLRDHDLLPADFELE